MSSILKSLKKLEEEKAAGRQQGAADVSRDILKGDIPRRKAKRIPAWPVLGLLVLLGIGGVLFLRTPPVATSPAQDGKPVVSAVVSDSQPGAGADKASSPVSPPAQDLVSVSRETTDVLKTTAADLQNTAAALKDKVVVPKEAGTAPVAAKPKKPAPTTPAKAAQTPTAAAEPKERKIDLASAFPPPPPKVQPVPVPPEARSSVWSLNNRKGTTKPVLKVSEIHWRNDVRERLAVVNDLPVMEGVVIDGAKVDRIFKDRIRFVVNGQYQEVLLTTQR